MKLVASILLFAFLVFAAAERLDSTVADVFIKVESRDDKKKLIDEEEVRAMIKEHIGYDVGISNNAQLDLMMLEEFLERDNRIKDAEVYLDKKNRIKVFISQKEPIVRIDVSGGEDYYLDTDGGKIPVIRNQIIRVPIVTGNIDAYTSNYQNEENHNLNMVLTMANKVSNDNFLNALVEQIHIEKNNEIVLIPKVGRSRILIGQIDGIDEKMYKLKTYYRQGIKHIGIDKFDELNMKIEGQVIGVNNT